MRLSRPCAGFGKQSGPVFCSFNTTALLNTEWHAVIWLLMLWGVIYPGMSSSVNASLSENTFSKNNRSCQLQKWDHRPLLSFLRAGPWLWVCTDETQAGCTDTLLPLEQAKRWPLNDVSVPQLAAHQAAQAALCWLGCTEREPLGLATLTDAKDTLILFFIFLTCFLNVSYLASYIIRVATRDTDSFFRCFANFTFTVTPLHS